MSVAPLLSSLVPTAPGTRLTVEETVAVIQEEVAISRYAPPKQQPVQAAPLPQTEDWSWQELRDYVIAKIEATVGVFPRTPYKEQAIFSGFVNRHGGARAAQVARYAFEVAGGYWKNAPISVNRFCANSDAYFAAPIAEHLDEVARATAARL